MGSACSSTTSSPEISKEVKQTSDQTEKTQQSGPPSLLRANSKVLRFQLADSQTNMPGSTPLQRRTFRTFSTVFAEKEELLLARHSELEASLDKFQEITMQLKDKKNMDESQYEHIYKLLEDGINEPFEKYGSQEQRLLMGNNLAKIGFVEAVVEYYIELSKNHGDEAFTEEFMEEEKESTFCSLMVLIRTILWNYADGSQEFGLKIATNTNLFQYLIRDLEEIIEEIDNIREEDGDQHFPFNSTLGIIHNSARSPVRRAVYNIKLLHQEDETVHIVDCLKPFIETDNTYVKLVALLALSFIVNEEQNKLLSADDSILDFLLGMIRDASKEKDRRRLGFSVQELVDGLANLARNDTNKIKIMNKGAFPELKKILSDGNVSEQTAVVKAIWELAFAQKNKKEFMGDKTLMTKIHDLEDSDNQNLAEAAQGASFVLKDLERDEGKRSAATVVPKEAKHIMMSYNWSDQKVILKIRDSLLQLGLSVWMDVDNMEGSILEGMANAVENASVVLICYSEKYKDSQNCRTEAEYAYKLKKDMVPLRMQERYEPDGWLGILLGNKMFYEFTTKYPYQDKFDELLKKEIFPRTDSLKEGQTTHVTPGRKASQTKLTAIPEKQDTVVITWTNAELTKWLKDNRLELFSGLKSLTGEQIVFLYKLFRRSPEFFYKCLEDKLGLRSLDELMRFSNAVERLSQEHPEIIQSLL